MYPASVSICLNSQDLGNVSDKYTTKVPNKPMKRVK